MTQTATDISSYGTPLVINLREILRNRISPKVFNRIPRFLINLLERIICQDELNAILRAGYPNEGSAFATSALNYLNISVHTRHEERIPKSGRFVFASNHPLGGLDGIALIKMLGERYGDENIRFLVNDMLMNIVPLRNVFLPINKYGAQGRHAAELINDAYESDAQMLVFPAGLVSRLQKGNEIKDLEWHKAFVAKAVKYHRDIIPLRFVGRNSSLFYKLAYYRKRLGVKANVEQALLPSELCKSRGKKFDIVFGEPIGWQSLRDVAPEQAAANIKSIVYSLH
jgi:putative hemolysin